MGGETYHRWEVLKPFLGRGLGVLWIVLDYNLDSISASK